MCSIFLQGHITHRFNPPKTSPSWLVTHGATSVISVLGSAGSGLGTWRDDHLGAWLIHWLLHDPMLDKKLKKNE